MPRGDRTGPMGAGPMTGRKMGYCAGYDVPGYMNAGYGRGYGRGFGRGFGRFCRRGFGFGRGFGWRAFAYNAPSKEELKGYINEEIRFLKDQLDSLEKRLKDLDSKEEA
ncbi:hypothetical protein SAMN02745135_02295 [Caloranaerobacter azorensis DSM 13643]|uniref:DUF5320 domain-containing protein n=1 Tax=Caloranaerobacter azorensis DSM 13643 TaxID=1121264 RepID=A0A1M5W4W5_9FIRM|nr:DUF5320 domain-containing protein [Caloranaerobacter azorensis]SHH82478.1 hypothetical protein SAMN02745135_02295 [Caloranaerobacter azorensis DSM 13643]